MDDTDLREQLETMLRLRFRDMREGDSGVLGSILSKHGIEERLVASWMEQAWPLVKQVREESQAKGPLTTKQVDEACQRNLQAFGVITGLGDNVDFDSLASFVAGHISSPKRGE